MNNLEVTIVLDPMVVQRAVNNGWQDAFVYDTYHNTKGYGAQWIENKLMEYIQSPEFNERLNDTLCKVVDEKLRETTIKVVDDILRGVLKKRLQEMLKDGSLIPIVRGNTDE